MSIRQALFIDKYFAVHGECSNAAMHSPKKNSMLEVFVQSYPELVLTSGVRTTFLFLVITHTRLSWLDLTYIKQLKPTPLAHYIVREWDFV